MIKVFRLLFLILFLKGVANAAPFLIENLDKNKINVVAFVTSWCPLYQKPKYKEHFDLLQTLLHCFE